MTENELSSIIVASAIEVHRTVGGPGLLESVYEEALIYELEQRGLGVERQKPPEGGTARLQRQAPCG